MVLLVNPRYKEKPHSHSPMAERATPPAPDILEFPFELPSMLIVTYGGGARHHLVEMGDDGDGCHARIELRKKNFVACEITFCLKM